MKVASSPMAAIEALHLDVAYVAVAKALGLPTQSYMALSDAKTSTPRRAPRRSRARSSPGSPA